MHDYNKPLEAAGREVGESSSRGLAQCSNALQSMVTSSTQHGSRLADSTQPSTGQRQCGREPEGNVEGVCPERHVDGCVACQPCETERLASVGDTPSQRRQPVHPEGQTNMVKPQGPVSTDNVLQLLESQKYRCALTGRELTPDTSALDHIIPIRCDGEHVIENTQVLHKDVNRAKGSLTNEEFIEMCRKVVNGTARQNTKGEEA